MFGFGGTPKTHGQLAKEEFGVGWDHMMQAATHAAGGMGSAVGPRMHGMRSMMSPAAGRVRTAASSGWDSTVGTFAPLVAAAREGAREATEAALKAQAKEDKRLKRGEAVKQKRIGLAVGLLAAGVAVGAAAALVVRRRRRAAWEDYDPSDALESMMDSVGDRTTEMRDGASDMRGSASDMRGSASEMKDKAADLAGDAKAKGGDAAAKAGDAAAKAGDSVAKAGDKASDRYADVSDRMR